jgi:hypothetical protein
VSCSRRAGAQPTVGIAVGGAAAALCRTAFVVALLGPADAVAQSASAPAAAPVRAVVEIDGVPASAWVGQVCELTVRVGVDAAWFAAQAVPLTAQALDQPFHVQIPWLVSTDDARVAVVPPPAAAATQRVAVGDRAEAFAVAAPRTIEGRAFTTLVLRVRWQPRREGVLSLAPVRLRYAFATAFVDDFLRGRQPRDRQEAGVAGASAVVPVSPLPQPAPAGFTGAVGRFTLAVAPASAQAEVGRAVPVTATLAGDGNFGDFAFALAQPLPGCHVDGIVAVPGSAGRAFRLDVLPLRAGLRELPPLAFAAFDPQRGGYATVASPTAPFAVAAASAPLPARVQQLVAADADAVAAAGPARRWPLAVGVAVALLVVGLARRRRRLLARRALVAAIDAFAAWPVGAPAPRLAAFEAALASVAGVPVWRADGFQALAARLPADVVTALRAHHGRLDAARFGGSAPPPDAVVADLRRALR